MKDSSHIPTVREIAKAAGVSPMTVSRALNGAPAKRTASRQRIRELAESMGWKPNPLVSALMSQRVRQHGTRLTANLAILDPRSDDPTANHEHIRGSLERAARLGYQAEVVPYVPAEIPPARLREILIARGIRGIVVMPLPVGRHELEFNFDGFAAVTIGYSLVSPVLPRVANDTQNNVHTALRHYEERGYTRVGLIMSDDANRRMLCQYSSAADTYDRFFSQTLRVSQLILPDEEFSSRRIKEILRWIREHRLQGILSSAQHLHRSFIEAGVRIPGDFSYVHLHRSLDGPTSINQLRALIGHKAVDLVTSMIQRNETHPVEYPQITLTPSELVDGDTTPALTRKTPR